MRELYRTRVWTQDWHTAGVIVDLFVLESTPATLDEDSTAPSVLVAGSRDAVRETLAAAGMLRGLILGDVD